MTWNFADSFDLYGGGSGADMVLNYWDGSSLNPGSSGFQAGRFTPSKAINPGSPTRLDKVSGVNDPVHHIVCAFYQNSVVPNGTSKGAFFTLYDGATVQCCIVFVCDGSILLTNGATGGGTVLATYSNAFTLGNTWYAYEFEIVIHNTAGTWKVRRNGNPTEDFTATGLDTQGSANAYANKIQFGSAAAAIHHVDDFYWRSEASAGNWIGDIRCYTRMPYADVQAQFTGSGTRSITFGATSGLGIVANRTWFGAFTPTYNATFTTVTYIAGTITGNLKCAVFADDGAGKPGALIQAAVAGLTAPSNPTPFTFTPPVPVTNGVKYWLGFCISATGGSTQGGLPATGYFSDVVSYASFPASTMVGVAMTGGGAQAVGSTITLMPANSGLVNEAQSDYTTTYVFSSTPGAADFYSIDPISATPNSVLAVVTRALMTKSDAGTRTACVQLKSGATTVATPTLVLTPSNWQWAWRMDLTDPATGAAWAPAAVNTVQIGPKVIA